MTWNYTYSEPEWKDEDGEWCWEEYSFLTFQWGGHPWIPGLYHRAYDGIPYKVLSFCLFCINWGRAGTWVICDERENDNDGQY